MNVGGKSQRQDKRNFFFALTNRIQNEQLYTFVCNRKEKDYESGFHLPRRGFEHHNSKYNAVKNYRARYYWSELLTNWLSVDPMMDKYPNISPYAYCAWNPVKYVDPNGLEVGDYYSESGKYLGTDKNNDGKIYVVPFKSNQRAVKKGNFDVEKYELPSLEVRQQMCDYLESSDNSDNLREYGGTIWEDEASGFQEIRRAIPGNRWDGISTTASVSPNISGKDGFNATGKRILTFFHSHFSGELNGRELQQFPSGLDNGIENGDIQNVMKEGERFGNARLPYNIMVAMKTRKVFIYNNVGIKCIMSMDVYKTMGEIENENTENYYCLFFILCRHLLSPIPYLYIRIIGWV